MMPNAHPVTKFDPLKKENQKKGRGGRETKRVTRPMRLGRDLLSTALHAVFGRPSTLRFGENHALKMSL